MSTESKEKKEGAACCDPKEFKGMFEMMSKCCTGESGFSNCSDMMERMKAMCCGQKAEGKKTD